MKAGTHQPTRARRRWIVAEVICACIVILALAQALTAALGQAAFSTLAAATTAERVGLLARDAAERINTGLRLGKPLEQYFGLERQLSESVQRLPDLTGAVVMLPSGYALATVGSPPDVPAELVQAAMGASVDASLTKAGLQRLGSGVVMVAGDQALMVAVPLSGTSSRVDGALLLAVDASVQAAREAAFRQRSLFMLAATTATAGVLLLVVLGWLMPYDMLVRPGGRARMWVPLAVLIVAQAVYAGHAVSSFRTAWIESTRGNVAMLAQGLQTDLNRVLGMGIDIHRMRGVDKVLSRLTSNLPAIGTASMLDAQGVTLATAGDVPADPQQMRSGLGLDLVMDFALGPSAGQGHGAGMLRIALDGDVIAAGVRERLLDAGTVALISAVAIFELFLLL
nr:MFS transporter [Pseudomonas sp.]